jgi:hypothetical protein
VMAEGAGDFETKKALEIVVGRILTEAQKNWYGYLKAPSSALWN